MKLSQKTKNMTILGYTIWIVYILLSLGLVALAIVCFLGNNNVVSINNPTIINNLLWLFALILACNTILHYYLLRKNYKALSKLNYSFITAEDEGGATLDLGKEQQMGTLTVSAILNHSLENLNRRHNKLKEKIEINYRLSENISAFYNQMKTLQDADLIFDFYEYDINNSIFVFLSGLISTLAKSVDKTEITADELFSSYKLNVSLTEFKKHLNDSINENTDMSFECSVEAKTGKTHWLRFWGRLSNDKTRITGAVTDVTRELKGKNLEKERATRDNITGFYNRNALQNLAGRAIAECAEDERVIFVYIGLTGYQEFQERFGKMAANSYIRECAKVFNEFVKSNMIPLRWLGPDFLLLVTGTKNIQQFKKNTIKVMHRVENRVTEVEGITVSFPVAVGYAVSGIHGQTPAELLEYASFAEHEAIIGKKTSPNEFNYERFEASHKVSLRRTHIKEIIEENQLSIVFQPIVSLKTGELYGFEALSRPTNPVYSNIVDLIDDAEASGNYIPLEKRMVYNALNSYLQRDEQYKDHYLFINTAPYPTLDEDDYKDIKNRYFSSMNVVFEVIERERIDPEEINLRKSIVKKAGAKFALDDFGSGYSNHLALLSLEPDIIKIDRQLVQNINEDLRKQYMLEDIIRYARYRGTRVLAEGVEIKEELETLCRMGIDYVQGYFIAKPNHELIMPSTETKELIKSINPNAKVQSKQIFIIIEKTFEKINYKLGQDLSIVLYLVTKMSEKLGFDKNKIKDIVITTMLHNIGRLYPGSEYNISTEDNSISAHSIFAYLLFKEFSPCPEYARAILYHHKNYNADEDKPNMISIPEEAYILSITTLIADIILGSDLLQQKPEDAIEDVYTKVMLRLNKKDLMLEHRKVLVELCQEGILNKIITGEYKEELLEYINKIDLNKAEIESILRTFAYSITFRSTYNYSHAKNMESTVDVLGRMTKQSWHLLENVRMAAILYNISMLFMDTDEFEEKHDPKKFHEILSRAVEHVNDVLKEAGLQDTVNIFKASIGEKTFGSQHMLMSKDIIDGAKILNLAEIFASIIEQGDSEQGISYNDAIEELVAIGNRDESLYHPSLNLIGEYKEDVEARIKSSQDDIEKHYNNIMPVYNKLKRTLLEDHSSDTSWV